MGRKSFKCNNQSTVGLLKGIRFQWNCLTDKRSSKRFITSSLEKRIYFFSAIATFAKIERIVVVCLWMAAITRVSASVKIVSTVMQFSTSNYIQSAAWIDTFCKWRRSEKKKCIANKQLLCIMVSHLVSRSNDVNNSSTELSLLCVESILRKISIRRRKTGKRHLVLIARHLPLQFHLNVVDPLQKHLLFDDILEKLHWMQSNKWNRLAQWAKQSENRDTTADR